ncbi:hypothetical protein WICPIJ_005888 [Wickerhamomyces pijperi]|uniref:Uncharacterized protein n=1 Tax=Wickerhamomyces pijperi TaxID=599730 RepID=A0A9P8Q4T2_WICPI|nr:hypothetical protein WICPIJ_005888 [Wickerhamomyces pijperi]
MEGPIEETLQQQRRLSSRKLQIPHNQTAQNATANNKQRHQIKPTTSARSFSSFRVSKDVRTRTQNITLLPPRPSVSQKPIKELNNQPTSKPKTVPKRITMPKFFKGSTLAKKPITLLSSKIDSQSITSNKISPTPKKASLEKVPAVTKLKSISDAIPNPLPHHTTLQNHIPTNQTIQNSSMLFEYGKFRNDQKSLVNQSNQSFLKLHSFISLLNSNTTVSKDEKPNEDTKLFDVVNIINVNKSIKLATVIPSHGTCEDTENINMKPTCTEKVMLLNYGMKTNVSTSFKQLSNKDVDLSQIKVQLLNHFKLENGMRMYYNYKVIGIS